MVDCLYWVRSRCALCPICISLTNRGRANPCSPTPVAGLLQTAALPPAKLWCDGCCRVPAASVPTVAEALPTAADADPTAVAAGPTEHDAGPTAADAGPTAAEVGPTAASVGPTAVDAGPTAADAGPTAAGGGMTAAGAATTGGSWHGSPAMMMNL